MLLLILTGHSASSYSLSLQGRESRPRAVKELAQRHTARKDQIWVWTPQQSRVRNSFDYCLSSPHDTMHRLCLCEPNKHLSICSIFSYSRSKRPLHSPVTQSCTTWPYWGKLFVTFLCTNSLTSKPPPSSPSPPWASFSVSKYRSYSKKTFFQKKINILTNGSCYFFSLKQFSSLKSSLKYMYSWFHHFYHCPSWALSHLPHSQYLRSRSLKNIHSFPGKVKQLLSPWSLLPPFTTTQAEMCWKATQENFTLK